MVPRKGRTWADENSLCSPFLPCWLRVILVVCSPGWTSMALGAC